MIFLIKISNILFRRNSILDIKCYFKIKSMHHSKFQKNKIVHRSFFKLNIFKSLQYLKVCCNQLELGFSRLQPRIAHQHCTCRSTFYYRIKIDRVVYRGNPRPLQGVKAKLQTFSP